MYIYKIYFADLTKYSGFERSRVLILHQRIQYRYIKHVNRKDLIKRLVCACRRCRDSLVPLTLAPATYHLSAIYLPSIHHLSTIYPPSIYHLSTRCNRNRTNDRLYLVCHVPKEECVIRKG